MKYVSKFFPIHCVITSVISLFNPIGNALLFARYFKSDMDGLSVDKCSVATLLGRPFLRKGHKLEQNFYLIFLSKQNLDNLARIWTCHPKNVSEHSTTVLPSVRIVIKRFLCLVICYFDPFKTSIYHCFIHNTAWHSYN